MNAPPRLVYAGTPDFAVPPLQALLAAGLRPQLVLTQPDRPAGRGRRLAPSPVKRVALEAGLPLAQPVTLRDSPIQSRLAAAAPDLIIVVAYGLMLPPAVLAIPRLGCLNLHASLLPRWRGAAPIQHAILAGDPRSGVSIMRMTPGLDTGPVYLCRELSLDGRITGGELHDRLADLGATALMEALPQILAGRLQPIRQDEAEATYAGKLSKQDARLDWHRNAARLSREVRAFNPWPVSFARLGDETIRVWRAEAVACAGSGTPGEVVAQSPAGIDVATASGCLRLLELQRPGRRRVSAGEFLRSGSLLGSRFL